MRRRSAMPYTNYVLDCCTNLGEDTQFPTDRMIPYLVGSQELARRTFDVFSYDDPSSSSVAGEAMVKLTTDALVRELDLLRRSLPIELQTSRKRSFRLNASMIGTGG